ncbi:hypothetical protein GCM10010166_57030 [Couchioplanes caeruleus subsp. azureus]|nr:hypothetical protein GCM10010166_57030 [Couchioplanes caeruleus subsp. azureus]
MVYEAETVVVFMDLNRVTPGHLLVVSREHAMGLEDLDDATSVHLWSVGHDMARALRRSSMGCEGINVLSATVKSPSRRPTDDAPAWSTVNG